MPQSANQTSTESLADVFIELERRGIARKAIAAAMGVGDRYVGYVVAGEKTPSYAAMQLLNQRGGAIVSQVLSEHFCRHSPCRANLELIADTKSLDVNHDGRVDGRDLIAHLAGSIDEASNAVRQACENSLDNKQRLREVCQRGITNLKLALQTIDIEDAQPMRLANR